ncbi:MAG TPA: DUF3825 domain-containing protein [Candidatus Binataceae bacterium]|nr:DUF3825 domain-containing protein [Candidatus Binataceae bacterium]
MFDKDALVSQLGVAATAKVTERLRRFAFLPDKTIERLSAEALPEEWGNDLFVLVKYLAVHVAWSIIEGRFTQSENQIYVSAGHLQTRYGTPLYLVFEPNPQIGKQPYILVAAGSRISAPELPLSPSIPEPPTISRSAEIVMSHDHILGDHADRVKFLAQTPPVSQICAVAGAIQWSINRNLQIPYWYFGRMNYVVPLYLTSRENITMAPDLIAPIEVSAETLLVRTILEPHMPYANARVAVRRHDQLPAWMLDAWNREARKLEEAQIEDPEA